ncbi:LytR/AlgR family response regulator transcription factor [Runella sp.]|uniref:LytR/AlgR family response regulator transcription factor n=1 Tax=Runella sp. TaxID=1960881 RepID=UPI0038F702E1
MNATMIPALYYSYQHKLPIDLSQVVRLEGTGNYTTFILSNGTSHLSSKSLCVYAPNLPVSFVRVHKGCIINRRFVVRFDRKRRCVLMTDNVEIQVARRRLKEVQKV